MAGEHAFADHTDAALAKVVAQGVVTGMVGREATVQEQQQILAYPWKKTRNCSSTLPTRLVVR